jgi:hypothetical protein
MKETLALGPAGRCFLGPVSASRASPGSAAERDTNPGPEAMDASSAASRRAAAEGARLTVAHMGAAGTAFRGRGGAADNPPTR